MQLARSRRLIVAGVLMLGAGALLFVPLGGESAAALDPQTSVLVDFAASSPAQLPSELQTQAFAGGSVALHEQERDGRRMLVVSAPAGGGVLSYRTPAGSSAIEETYTFVYSGPQSVVDPFFANAHATKLEGFMVDLSESQPGMSFAGTVTYRYTDASGKEQHVAKGRLRTEPYFYRTGRTYRVDAIADMTSGLLTARVYDVALGPQTFDTSVSAPSHGTQLVPGLLLPASAVTIGDFAFGPVGRLPVRSHPARRAGDYMNFLGYNATVEYGLASPKGRAFIQYFPALLIKHVRVPAEPRFLAPINALARDGIDADVLTGNHTTLPGLRSFISGLTNPPDAIELWNEPNNPSEGGAYDSHYAVDLPAFAAAVRKAYPRTNIWGPSVLPDPNGYGSAIAKLSASVGPFIDAWNAHSYTLGTPENLGYGGSFGNACGPSHKEDCGWYGAANYNDNLSAIMNPDLPGVTTEGAASYGSYPDICGHSNVDLRSQQAYIERGMLYNFKLGHLRVYPYKFVDDGGCSDGFGTYGILSRLSGPGEAVSLVPKPAYVSLVALDHLLDDNGRAARSFVAAPASYTLEGATPDVETLLLAHSDGSYRLVVWSDASLWDFNANGDHAAGRALPLRSKPVTIRFAEPVNAAVYTQQGGTGAWAFRDAGRSAAVNVTIDQFPQVIAFDANAGQTNALPRDIPTAGPAETAKPHTP